MFRQQNPTIDKIPNPRVRQADVMQVLQNCGIIVTSDQKPEFDAYFVGRKDKDGFVDLKEFLNDLGLPPQTIGSSEAQKIPRGKFLGAQ